jgi:hypothetical protein
MKTSRGISLFLVVLFGVAFAAHVCESKHFTVRVADASKLAQVRVQVHTVSACSVGDCSGTA